MIKSKFEDMHIAIEGKTTIEKKFYISNCKKYTEKVAKYIRKH